MATRKTPGTQCCCRRLISTFPLAASLLQFIVMVCLFLPSIIPQTRGAFPDGTVHKGDRHDSSALKVPLAVHARINSIVRTAMSRQHKNRAVPQPSRLVGHPSSILNKISSNPDVCP